MHRRTEVDREEFLELEHARWTEAPGTSGKPGGRNSLRGRTPLLSAVDLSERRAHLLFEGTDGERLLRRTAGEPFLELSVRGHEEGTCMTRTEDTLPDESLDRRRELEEPERVRHRRPRSTDALGDLLVREVEILDQLLVGGSLIERVEILPLHVLDEGALEACKIIDRLDECGDRLESCAASGATAALAGDELELLLVDLSEQHGLNDPDRPDGVDEPGERLLVEVGARLEPVRVDVREGDLPELARG
jgi:hypothetical protein